MRYEDRAVFQLEQVATYNPKTSKKENTLITYDAIPCNINPISRARKQLEFGDLKNDVSVLRIKESISSPVSHVLINGIRYKIVDTRTYRHETSYYIEEVN
ncbi:TPA: hypothetical protein PP471_000232 [Staphylococcus aureus]|uniref:Phage protein n=1 Tax=Staphylococcus aureus TaxID=1280 RepID=A0A6A8FD26_STAAU|nr:MULTISPECIES: hypothetical protein [Staphylococcus]EJX2044099.1 hypothetical protein [Staphylococcus aureus]EZY64029.1 hypothetical protein V061_00878 [Staphylococcus aureus R0353]MBS3426800.1 hypothetical protein [Staphylococcus aureus]MBU6701868.1 hypothetical protein [Staphylococcus aureus]MBY0818635.1 hypothetical protein [Staphylococcus aureus]